MSNRTESVRDKRSITISGTVVSAKAIPIPGLRVVALSCGLRHERIVGEAQTDKSGIYCVEIMFGEVVGKGSRAGKVSAVAVWDITGRELTRSKVINNNLKRIEVNFSIPALTLTPPAHYTYIDRLVQPLLGKHKIEGLEENEKHRDLTFIAAETGLERPVLARFVLAHCLACDSLQPEYWFALLSSSLFEYNENVSLKENLSALRMKLPTLDERSIRKAIARSVKRYEITEKSEKVIDAWVEAFLEYISNQVLGDAKSPSFIRSALEEAGVKTAKRQAKFSRLFNEHKALTPELLENLDKDRSFKKTEIADLRASYQLADLTQGDFSVVKALKKEFNIGKPEDIPKLAKNSEEDWIKLIERKHKSRDIQIPKEFVSDGTVFKIPEAEFYAKSLAREFREVFPTAAFSGGLERALGNGGAQGIKYAQKLIQLIERHPEFDLLKTPVDEFLDKGHRSNLRSLARDESFRVELKAAQRLAKLVQGSTEPAAVTDVLMADRVHSAQMIYRMGRSEFIRRYAEKPGFSRETAKIAWTRAADTHAAVITLVGDLKALDPETLPEALKNDGADLSKFPNWENLFKSGDICHCEHCRSVLSPAAYFTDLLMFLRERESKNPGTSVRDLLYNRRPDLEYIELNCENALTPLPYVDVVCEVLENAVAGEEGDIELVGLAAIPADPADAKTKVATALETAGIDVGADFTLSQVESTNPDEWVVHGDDATYRIFKKTTSGFFARILPNTKASSAELKAYPANTNPEACKKLRAARYPMELPFDLYAEEVRTAFGKSKLYRWDLMQTFMGAAQAGDPADAEIAAEYFGISCDENSPIDEKRLIWEADTSMAGQKAVWGETGTDWLSKVGNVKAFLNKTRLEYEELLGLLDLKFINPNGDIVIQHDDSSCDTDKKTLQGINATKLDRIHRFLRMWRKLDGWKMWELDLAIRCKGVGEGKLDGAFLVNLFYFDRLRKRLGKKASVEELCALFENLNVESHFTEAHKKRTDSLYQNLFLNKRVMQPLDPVFEVDIVSGTSTEKISGHRAVVTSALRVNDVDLEVLISLNTDPSPDDLTLGNLSFLWRHAWLAKLLKLKAPEWKCVLKLLGQPVQKFADAKSAFEFVEQADQLGETGFSPDELNWILTADSSAKSAVKEEEAAKFLTDLRSELKTIQERYDPTQFDFLNPPSDTDGLTELLTSLLQQLNRNESDTNFFIDTLKDTVVQEVKNSDLPADFSFPDAVTTRIKYNEGSSVIRFTGYMTDEEKDALKTDASLSSITGIASYQQAIDELFEMPRLALKLFKPVFSAPLETLPTEVDFQMLDDSSLASRVSYDSDKRELVVTGILGAAEKAALQALATSSDIDYLNAVNSLYLQPRASGFSVEEEWVTESDLTLPLKDETDPSNDHLNINLAAAINKALAYLYRVDSENLVVQKAASELGLSESMARILLTEYKIGSEPIMVLLSEQLAESIAAVVSSEPSFVPILNAWYFTVRLGALWETWKINESEWTQIQSFMGNGQLLDFQSLPESGADAAANIDQYLRTDQLLHLRRTLPETGITLLQVLAKLEAGEYSAEEEFAKDVELLNEDWAADSVKSLIDGLDTSYPNDYLLVETWHRIQKAFYYLDKLNADVSTASTFAAVTMDASHASAIKQQFHSRFGNETWLSLSEEIQNSLRDRKRAALTAYLLTQPVPADVPTGKWENTNDLYAYYLLDVEMCSCQLTSRLVQASGSVQLFVQRCFMGLEPDVAVHADGPEGDSAWRWWKWMRKYRVWEANRKVFLWPENWIEPELKKDRSPFFKDLENELVQNELNEHTVETAFTNYLEKLDGVAQLEVAGFYQEDDGDNTILHVFGRTTGAEPHLYYYRRYDYRQWTPWEKVELDIQGDYLIPAVINKRLYLFWPVFTEIQDEKGNDQASYPDSTKKQRDMKAKKKLKLQLAVSSLRQGKWTPKKISKDAAISNSPYSSEIVRNRYEFFPVDLSASKGRFGIRFKGNSENEDGDLQAYLNGVFDVAGCDGVPVLVNDLDYDFKHVIRPEEDSVGERTGFLRWEELESRSGTDADDDLTLQNFFNGQISPHQREILDQTPNLFRINPPWHTSYMDQFLTDMPANKLFEAFGERAWAPAGSWLPFFYRDRKRTFHVLPAWTGMERGREASRKEYVSGPLYYPDIKKLFKNIEVYYEAELSTRISSFNLPAQGTKKRQELENRIHQNYAPDDKPPYTDDEIRELMLRFMMRLLRYQLGAKSLWLYQFSKFHFLNFYHPFVCDFAKLVHNPLEGIPGLMRREVQLKDSGFSFHNSYLPTKHVLKYGTEKYYPRENVDFSPAGAYSPYNWELFFHAPLLIANSLSKNQRFEEARDWYHFIFNPIGVESGVTGGSVMSKYWITKPFFLTTDKDYLDQRIENVMSMLAGDTNVPGYSADAQKSLVDQVEDWRNNPFEPHRIANYRTVAYQKTVVMKYLDNLIEWGDYLFRQDSMESINEATQLYVLAAEILGPRPRKVPPQVQPPVESFKELEKDLDAFANALVEVENLVPVSPGGGTYSMDSPPLPMLYFCIPHNENLLEYWDTVADRLYKIRHCMNIEGVVRQLALFEPPIDPAALVKAVAGGMGISSALSDLNAPLPLYRFNVMLQKANEVCNDVKALGAALLSALEKKDAEELNLLRQGQEIQLLEAITAIREKQIEEAKENLEGVKKGKELAQIKKQYYASREFMNAGESTAVGLSTASGVMYLTGTIVDILGSVMATSLPDLQIGGAGIGGSPVATATFGGSNTGMGAQLAARALYQGATVLDKTASITTTLASYGRRQDDWDHQKDLAEKEIEQFEESITAAELRVSIAEKELENHKKQIENAKATDEFMRSKYTNKELYQWQIGQISGVYFQSYKLAYDLAKQAERCYRFELGLKDSSYINFGYWDSLKKGLLSGEKLQYDLRRLESAYMEGNRREYELTKHVSLKQLDPLALIQLRETGRCFLDVPEEIFDLDYPGHYFRRVKSVSLSIPCVTGPYTTMACTLRLLGNKIRINTSKGDNDNYARNVDDDGMPANDTRFVENNIPVKAIATSNGQNDSGVFELSFRDERYLPFEGAGAISNWAIELFHDSSNSDATDDFGKSLRQFDYNTITDAVLHIKYTAREDSGLFKNGAVEHLKAYLGADDSTPAAIMLNMRNEFPTQWSQMLNPTDPTNGNVLKFDLGYTQLPRRDSGQPLKINKLYLFALTDDGTDPGLELTAPFTDNDLDLENLDKYGQQLLFAEKDVKDKDLEISDDDNSIAWSLKVDKPSNLKELILVVGYQRS